MNDQRRWIGEKVLHGPVDFLLVADPLIGAAECCCDLIDPLRYDFRVRRQDGLLAQQLHLLLNPGELRIEKGELFDRFAFFLLPLLKNFELCGEALSQVFGDLRLLELFLQLLDSLFQLGGLFGRVRRLANDFTDGFSGQEQTQIDPYQTSEAFSLLVHAGRQRCATGLLLEDPLTAAFQRAIALLVLWRKLLDQIEDLRLPASPFGKKLIAVHKILKSRIRAEPAEVCEFASEADNPEPGVENAQQTE